MFTLNLNGVWKVSHVPYGSDITPLLAPTFLPEGFLDAHIPEDIHATLRRAGAIRGNTYGKREDEEKWIEECDWLYFKAFSIAPDMAGRALKLVFEGLDTFCEIYLNGSLLGTHQNMFTPCSFDLDGRLLCGQRNVLLIRFFSPVRYVEGRDERNIFSITTSDRIFARKAQMNYSWDFCGRCVSLGIWKPVAITESMDADISGYYAYTETADPDKAVVAVEAELSLPVEAHADFTVHALLSLNDQTFEAAGPCEDSRAVLRVEVPQPALWWPRPYGQQPLYTLEVTLLRCGRMVASRRQRFGIRSLQVLQEPQADGISFQFCVNGRRLFIRGANWVPLNTVYTDLSRKDYEEVLHYAAQSHLSMLRVWGGGIYESDDFYDLCDEYGILVWQDFMLACGIYPHDEAFLSNLAEEAEHVLRRYRNHTCLALWAGDNENGQAYIWAGRTYEYSRDPINHRVLKDACARLDPHRFYLPTSPGSPNPEQKGGDNQESPYQGDAHIYIMSADPGKTAYRDYGRDYYKRILGYRPRFVSEFGFISLPEKDTFYRFNVRREPLRNVAELTKFLPFTGELLACGDTDAVIHYSQLFNAMALKYWIEYFRSLKGTCSGTLFWKFDDPLADCPDGYLYPSHMSCIDMYHQPKMSYYYTRRAYADVLIAFIEQLDGGIALTACNELTEDFDVQIEVSRRSFDGSILAQQRLDCHLPGDAARQLCLLGEPVTACTDPCQEYLLARMTSKHGCTENRYFFADLHELNRLKLPEGRLEVQAQWQGDGLVLHLKAWTFIHCLRIILPDLPADLSDCYFDMEPHTCRDIPITLRSTEDLMSKAVYLEATNLIRQYLPLSSL